MLLMPTRSWRTASTKTQVAREKCMSDVRRSWGWEAGKGSWEEKLLGTLAS